MIPDKLPWAYLKDATSGEEQEPTVFAVTQPGCSVWRALLHEHMPFHHVREEDRAVLLDKQRDLEHIFLGAHDSRLSAYYKEAWLGIPPVNRELQPATDVNANDADLMRHVVHLQALLMAQAVEALRLDRYANAPPNRGWMNLFRRWGASWTFNYWFDELRDTFSRSFVHFYDDYVRYIGQRIDEVPLRHPWDMKATFERRVERLQDEIEHRGTRIKVEPRPSPYPGLFLDSGTLEQHAASASEASVAPDAAPPKEGHAGEAPPGAPATDDHSAPNA